jgi:hypothetical protein
MRGKKRSKRHREEQRETQTHKEECTGSINYLLSTVLRTATMRSEERERETKLTESAHCLG